MESSTLIQNAERKLEEDKEKNSESVQNQIDSGCESFTINSGKSSEELQEEQPTPPTPSNIEASATNPEPEVDIDDIIIHCRDPVTNKSIINKTAYVKLHRAVSPTRNSTTVLREKYEISEPKLETETLHSLKIKYSPSSFGYPKLNSPVSQIPVPKPRNYSRSQSIENPSKFESKTKLRYSFPTNTKRKDENSNNIFRKSSSSSGEFITIVTRSDSEGSVDKFEKELNLFTMEGKTKDKKRNNSFRKIFTGKLFSRDKKKVEDPQSKLPCKENVAYSDNIKNESNVFNRQSPYRHTTGGNTTNKETKIYRTDSQRSTQKPNLNTKEIDQRYAQMHINEFQGIKRTFENKNSYQNDQYVKMNRPVPFTNPGPISYSKMPNIGKYIDTSSSSSTLNSERDKIYHNEGIPNKHFDNKSETIPHIGMNRITESSREGSRATPPRAQELRQDVRLVNPKALSPIQFERQTGNPHQQYSAEQPKPNTIYSHQLDDSSDAEEEYGRVFDSIEGERPVLRNKPELQRSNSFRSASISLDRVRISNSPSLESTKLKLPTNREIVPLSPRMRSPIPQDRVSTEKIIATELLKPARSPTPTRVQANTVGDNSNYNQNNKNIETDGLLLTKPPIARVTKKSIENIVTAQDNNIQRIQNSPINEHNRSTPGPEEQERHFTNAMIHVYPQNVRSPTPTNQVLRSASPMRPQSVRSVTPVDMRPPSSNKSQSPQKEDIRRSVEAYYWSEIKKLKEQKDQDYYYYQTQMIPYGYVDDSVNSRRSRSMSPSVQRNGRRSLSLPRDPRPSNTNTNIFVDKYGRIQPKPIPEGSVVTHQQKIHYQNYNIQQNFLRNAPERQSVDGLPRSHYSTNSLYRPIFKRGSLTAPIRELDDQQNKKVSFSGSRNEPQQNQVWPTRNGYTQNPPQRRSDGNNPNYITDDDVFLPVNSQTSKLIINGKEVYGYANVPQQLLPTGHQLGNEDYSRQNVNEQSLYGYTSPHYQINNPQREPLYGPLVVANVRPNQTNLKESPYGPLVVTNNRVSQIKAPGNPQEDGLYGQPIDAIRPPPGRPLTRHNSVQLPENVYGQRQQPSRKMSYDNSQIPITMRTEQQMQNANHPMQRREIIMTDDIFGQFGGYIPQDNNVQYVNIVRQSNVESPYGRQNNVESSYGRQNNMESLYGRQNNVESRYIIQNNVEPSYGKPILEPSYGINVRHSNAEQLYGYGKPAPRQITVRNKVCDIYGQIHDKNNISMTPTHQQSGVVLGHLQKSPQVIRQSYSQLPNENFVRNSRLTASASDMHRRSHNVDPRYRSDVIYQRKQHSVPDEGAPTRPLPPVPTKPSPSVDQSKIPLNTKQKPKKEKKKRSFFGKSSK